MSKATTPSRQSRNCRMSSKRARWGVVQRIPTRSTMSCSGNGSRDTRAWSSERSLSPADPTASRTGRRRPVGSRPSKYAAPWSRQEPHPETAPPRPSLIDCSSTRCSGTSLSTDAGTWNPRLVRRQPRPTACPGVGPARPAGSGRSGRTSAGGGGATGSQWPDERIVLRCREAAYGVAGHPQVRGSRAGRRSRLGEAVDRGEGVELWNDIADVTSCRARSGSTAVPGPADAGGPGPARDAGQPAQITVSEGV